MNPRTIFNLCVASAFALWAPVSVHGQVTVSDGGSVLDAIKDAAAGTTITVDSDDVFEEILSIQGVESGIVVEAAPGKSPVIEGNDGLDWEDDFPFRLAGILVVLDTTITFRGIRFRIDLTGLGPYIQDNPDPDGEPSQVEGGYEILRNVGRETTVILEDCTFEYSGSVGDPRVFGAGPGAYEDTCTLNGAGSTTFNRCTWLYSHDIIEKLNDQRPFNSLQALVPSTEGESNEVIVNDCTFGMLSHVGPRTGGGTGRSISTGGGGGGVLNMEVNRCTFGNFRRHIGQFQQAWAYPSGSNVNLVFRECYFPDGCGRFLGGVGDLSPRYERCTFHHSYGGQLFLPDPGGTGVVECDNCLFTYVSNNRPGETELIRGTNGIGFRFRHCTFVDLSGENAEAEKNPDPLLMKIDNNISAFEFTNCIFEVPGYTKQIVQNIFGPGIQPDVGIIASGNLINSATFPLTEGVLPEGAFAVQGDPMLAEDYLHLQAGSPAIDALTSSGTDIDGQAIPATDGSADIGADEYVAPGIVRPRRTVTFPGDTSTFLEAMARAHGNTDEIIITEDGPFFELIRTDYEPFQFTEVSSFLHVRAADGVNPIFAVDQDTNWGAEPGLPASAQTIAAAGTLEPFATAVYLRNSISFDGIHFRADLTDQAIIDLANVESSSIMLIRVSSRQGEFRFVNCIFEATGNPEDPLAFGARNMVSIGGPTANTFEGCEWRYNMDLQKWPEFTNSLAYGMPVQDGESSPVFRLDINNCVFDAVADTRDENEGGKSRHIGGGGGPGEGVVNINNTVFGANRERFNEPAEGAAAGHLDGMVNHQVQQAQISIAGDGVRFTVNDCTFLDGTDRQFGADPNTAASGVFINRCVLEPTTVGSAILGDPGATGFFLTNSVVRYDSRHLNGGAPIRLWAEGADRAAQFVHCLFQDVAGLEGDSEVNVASMDDTTGLNSGVLSTMTNCIVDAPAMAEGVFENIDSPGVQPVADNPGGSGNLLNTRPLSLQLLPGSAVLARGNPQLGEDNLHLSDCSLLAIDQVDGSAGVTDDIDGDPRPSGANFDVGPDEFTGTPGDPKVCVVDIGVTFRRADCDQSGKVDFNDAIFHLRFLFLGENEDVVNGCRDACDSDDSGADDFTDDINTLQVLFLGQGGIPAPGPLPDESHPCGSDPTEGDTADCVVYTPAIACP